MFKALIPGFLFSTVLAVAISTGAEAQEYIVHKFRCPDSVSGKTTFDRKFGSDPSFSLATANFALSAQFEKSSVVGQKVSCVYKNQDHSSRLVVYSYTVKRKLSNCQNVGTREFTCRVQ